jgi:hypothetical protein
MMPCVARPDGKGFRETSVIRQMRLEIAVTRRGRLSSISLKIRRGP